ncbi:MAG: hypothetical protein K0S57_2639 [Ramlibacter sp.]|jgi:hypothetical protein|nr:hypothetical protein [Ramlibacter sp.]
MTSNTQADDFDVGKAIFDQLKDLPTERQQRVLRWVAEGLGISSSPSAPPAPGTIASSPAAPAASPTPAGAAVDIKTFIAAKAPKSDVQFAAAVAYFYKFEAPPAARHDTIGSELLQEATRLAGTKRLSSPRHALKNAKAAGYLDSAARGEYSINSVGENLVAMTLPGGGNPVITAPRRKNTRKPSAPAKKAVRKAVAKKSRGSK